MQCSSTVGQYGRPSSGAEQTWQIEVPPGKHTIAVKADTAKSFALSPPIEVTRPAASTDAKPKLIILSAGGSADAAAASAVAKAMSAARPNDFGEAVTLDRARRRGNTRRNCFQPRKRPPSRRPRPIRHLSIWLEQSRSTVRAAIRFPPPSPARPTPGAHGLSEGELRRLLSGIQGRVVLATDTRRSQQHTDGETVKGFCGSSDQSTRSADWRRR